MQVSQSVNSYTLSLFQGASSGEKSNLAAAQPGPASYFAPADNTSLPGIYADPRVAQGTPARMSDATMRILDTIHSIVSNELKTIGATFRQMAEVDLEFEPEEKLPEDTRIRDLTSEQVGRLSADTRDAARLELQLSLYTTLATQGGVTPKGFGFILFGEKYVEMNDAELAEHQINALVDNQIKAIKMTLELSKSEEFIRFSAGTGIPTDVTGPLTDEELATLRSDLLAERRAQYQRGELNVNVTVFASTHAANYDKTYKTFDMASGETVVNEANTAAFDEAWEFSERKKEAFHRLLVGDSDFVRDNIERLGIYAEEYIKDATS